MTAYHQPKQTSWRTGLTPVDLTPKSCIIKKSKENNQLNPMRFTKAAVLEQFRYNWKCATLSNPNLKGDSIAKREEWSYFTDSLCKQNYITMKQYESWSNPF
jgi:hypothetical protein